MTENENARKLYYVCTPYSSPDTTVREARFQLACDAAGMLLTGGTHAFSPIAHTHPIAVRHDLPQGFDFWEAYDRAMIGRSDGIIVIMADGWLQSAGIAAEIRIARMLGKPLYCLPWPASYEVWLQALDRGPVWPGSEHQPSGTLVTSLEGL